MSSGAWREQVLPGAGLIGIAISIFSHLLFRKRRGEVLEKDSGLLREIRMDWLWSSSTCPFKGRVAFLEELRARDCESCLFLDRIDKIEQNSDSENSVHSV